ncbi:MAG: lipoprotein signal peptidase [Bacteroidia bacterium]|nr:lipoprotein signal peptidase [Bacteroidia bacterium]
MNSKSKLALILILSVIFIDQCIKIYIKLNYPLGIVKEFSDWAYLYFTENPGMAFGIEWGGDYGKLLLTLFRILACGFGIWFVRDLVRKNESTAYIVSVSLILAGAIGNIIDSVFYGVLFTESTEYDVAQLSIGNGYAPLFYGKVVDMFYFPLFSGTFPKWLPIWGGEEFLFFRPIFNFADASITVGVFCFVLFHKQIHNSTATSPISPTESNVQE